MVKAKAETREFIDRQPTAKDGYSLTVERETFQHVIRVAACQDYAKPEIFDLFPETVMVRIHDGPRSAGNAHNLFRLLSVIVV